MKRIGIVPNVLPTTGGAVTFLINLVKVLPTDIEIILFIKHKDLNNLNDILKRDLRIILIPNNQKKCLKFCNVLLYEFITIREIKKYKLDTLIISSVTSRTLYGLMLFGKYSKIYFLHTVPNSRNWKTILFDKIIIFMRNYQFITVSNFSKEKMISNLGIRRDKILILPNYVEFDSLQSQTFLGETNLGCKNIILTIGSFEEYKNPKAWIETAEKILETENCLFIWIGTGSLINSYRELVKKKKLDKGIILLGEKTNVVDYLRLTTIYFQPSIKESQGIAIIEAMKFGLPCVTSNAEGIQETINRKVGISCEVHNIEEYTNAIRTLLKRNDLRKSLGKAAKEYVNKKYSRQEYKNKFNSILKAYD